MRMKTNCAPHPLVYMYNNKVYDDSLFLRCKHLFFTALILLTADLQALISISDLPGISAVLGSVLDFVRGFSSYGLIFAAPLVFGSAFEGFALSWAFSGVPFKHRRYHLAVVPLKSVSFLIHQLQTYLFIPDGLIHVP